MTHRRHENLRGYIKKVVVPGVWVNVSSDDANEKFSLLGALNIPGLTTSKDLKRWLRMEGVKKGMLIGYEEFYANTSGKKFLIAHGHKPVRNYWDQPDDTSVTVPGAFSEHPPTIPATIVQPAKANVSSSIVKPKRANACGNLTMEEEAAKSLLNGTITGEICVDGVVVSLDVNDATPFSPLQHAALTLLLDNSKKHTPPDRGELISYRQTYNHQSARWLLPVTVARKEEVKARTLKRKSGELKEFLDVTVGRNATTQGKVTANFLRGNERALEAVYDILAKVDLSNPISAETIAIELVQKGCMNFKQIKMLKELLEAKNYHIMAPLSHVRRLITANDAQIPKTTGVVKCVSKKDNNTTVNVPYLRVCSLLQASLTLIHNALIQGCVPPSGVPGNEFWQKGLGDAGGTRCLYALQNVMEKKITDEQGREIRQVSVNSINNTYIVAAFSTENAPDSAENMERAIFGPMRPDLDFLSSDACSISMYYYAGTYIASAFTDNTLTPSSPPSLLINVLEDKELALLSSSYQTFRLVPQDTVVVLLNSSGAAVGLASISFADRRLPLELDEVLSFLPTFDFGFSCDTEGDDPGEGVPGSRCTRFMSAYNVDLSFSFDDGEFDIAGIFKITGLFILPSPVPVPWQGWKECFGQGIFSCQERAMVKWEGGDLKYLAALLGIQGTGKRPCPICEKSSDHFPEKGAAESTERTTANLKAHATNLAEDTTAWHAGRLPRQKGVCRKGPAPIPKDYGSVERDALWDLPPDRLALPLLHFMLTIPLGWWRRFLEILRALDGMTEDEIKKADAVEAVHQQLDETKAVLTELKEQKIPKAKKDEEEHKNNVRRALCLGNNARVGLKSAQKSREKLAEGPGKVAAVAAIGMWDESIKHHAELTKEEKALVPLIKEMEEVLREIKEDSTFHMGQFEAAAVAKMADPSNQGGCGVTLAKHFGGSLDGNGAARLISYVGEGEYVFDRLLKSTTDILEDDLLHGRRSIANVQDWKDELVVLRSVLLKWTEISGVMHLTRKLEEEEIQLLETKCPLFVDAYYEVIGDNKGSKLHIIKDHVGPFARKFKVLYLLCEEAIESKHARWNRYARQFARVMDGQRKPFLMSELDSLGLGTVKSDAEKALINLKAKRARGPYKKN